MNTPTPSKLRSEYQQKHALQALCAKAVQQQIERDNTLNNKHRNRRRHLLKHLLKRLPCRRTLSNTLKAASLVLASWGLVMIPQAVQAATPTFVAVTGAANPLDGVGAGLNASQQSATPSFADLDGDGDLDAFLGSYGGTVKYYQNTGTASAPILTAVVGALNPFYGIDVGFRSAPSFVDIDGDGDLDAFIGESSGILNYYRNTGTASAPVFTPITGTANPLNGFDVGLRSTPSFADIDGDGDLDAFVGEAGNGTVKYYQNTGTANAPVFVAANGTTIINPLAGLSVNDNAKPSFVDVDGDGDLDAFIGRGDGTLTYMQNTGTASAPLFTAVAPHPLTAVLTNAFSAPSFVDIDGDGDLDAFIGAKDGFVRFYQNTTPQQTLTFTPTATAIAGNSATLSASSTSGLTVTAFGSTTPSVCTVAGSSVSFGAAGTCTVTANQAGDATYAAAPQVSANISVAPANIVPVATYSNVQVKVNTVYQGTLKGSDADVANVLAFSVLQNGTLGTLVITNAATGAYTYTASSVAGTDHLIFQVADGVGGTATANVNITLLPVNQIDALNLGDINGDGFDDIAMIDVNSTSLNIKSAVDGVSLTTIAFSGTFTPAWDAKVLPDMNGNGIAEVAILGVDSANGDVRADVFDALTGNAISSVVFAAGITPIRITSTPDISGNGMPELLMLGIKDATQGIQVRVRDALSGLPVGKGIIAYGSQYDARALVVVPDLDNNGFPEVAVVGRHITNNWSRIQVRDINTGAPVRQNLLNQHVVPQDMKLVPDMNGNGVSELAVAVINPTNGGGLQVHVNDVSSNASLSVVYFGASDTFIDFELVSDTTGDGIPEVAILSQSKTTGNVRVQTKDTATGGLLKSTFFNKNNAPQSLVVIGDVTGNAQPEIGVQGTDATQTGGMQIKGSLSSSPVNSMPVL